LQQVLWLTQCFVCLPEEGTARLLEEVDFIKKTVDDDDDDDIFVS
jgi:hypothetical protein